MVALVIGTLVSCALAWRASDESHAAIAMDGRVMGAKWASPNAGSSPKVDAPRAEIVGVTDPNVHAAASTAL